MEPLTLFASTVGVIAAFRIAFLAEEFFTQGRYSKGNTKGKRIDWCCFFQPSDLTRTKTSQSTVKGDKDIEKKRHEKANHPRHQASAV